MSTLEELEQRKKELQLRSEIARLERENRVRATSAKTAAWRWWWIAPLSVAGVFLAAAGLGDNQPGAVFLGLVLLVPLLLKVLGSRTA